MSDSKQSENMELCLLELAKVDTVLRHLIRDDLYSLEETELMYLAQTLATDGQDKLLNVCGWLEDMKAEAMKQEVRK